MWRYCNWLLLALLLAGGRAEAIEERELCWRGVCAGMTLPEVEARLAALDFTMRGNWLTRWLQRWQPQIGGNWAYEGYIERVSASRGAKCEPVPVRRPCSSMLIQFVRFPSGQRRLVSVNGAESTPTVRLASEIIADLKAVLGPPDRAEWRKWPEAGRGEVQWTLWAGDWNGERPGDWVLVRINVVEEADVVAGALSPPDLEGSIHASSIDFALSAHTVGLRAQRAWARETAD